jgi:CspA family cold shock protein
MSALGPSRAPDRDRNFWHSSLAMLELLTQAIRPGQHPMERAVATGTVKWFNPTKGYGFIQPQSGGKDVFVHISALERAGLSNLNEGATVDYDIVSDRGKESAGNLKVRK